MRTLFLFLLLVTMTGAAHAHSSGASLEAQDGQHHVDIGYEPGDLYAGGRMVLDFELWNDAGKTDGAAYSRVWTRVEKGGATMFATGVGKATLGPTTAMMRIPEEWVGEITVHVRYEEGNSTLASASFPLTIEPGKAPPMPILPFVTALTGMLAGGMGGLLAARYLKPKRL